MNIKEYNWFKYNVNEDRKSYTIINVDWNENRIYYGERYINHDNIDTFATGKIFFDENGEINFKNSGYDNCDETFEKEIETINNFPLWSKYENEIKKEINNENK
jgi:hypothetical protein